MLRQSPQRLALFVKSSSNFRRPGMEDFDRDVPIQICLSSPVDRAATAHSDQPLIGDTLYPETQLALLALNRIGWENLPDVVLSWLPRRQG